MRTSSADRSVISPSYYSVDSPKAGLAKVTDEVRAELRSIATDDKKLNDLTVALLGNRQDPRFGATKEKLKSLLLSGQFIPPDIKLADNGNVRGTMSANVLPAGVNGAFVAKTGDVLISKKLAAAGGAELKSAVREELLESLAHKATAGLNLSGDVGERLRLVVEGKTPAQAIATEQGHTGERASGEVRVNGQVATAAFQDATPLFGSGEPIAGETAATSAEKKPRSWEIKHTDNEVMAPVLADTATGGITALIAPAFVGKMTDGTEYKTPAQFFGHIYKKVISEYMAAPEGSLQRKYGDVMWAQNALKNGVSVGEISERVKGSLSKEEVAQIFNKDAAAELLKEIHKSPGFEQQLQADYDRIANTELQTVNFAALPPGTLPLAAGTNPVSMDNLRLLLYNTVTDPRYAKKYADGQITKAQVADDIGLLQLVSPEVAADATKKFGISATHFGLQNAVPTALEKASAHELDMAASGMMLHVINSARILGVQIPTQRPANWAWAMGDQAKNLWRQRAHACAEAVKAGKLAPPGQENAVFQQVLREKLGPGDQAFAGSFLQGLSTLNGNHFLAASGVVLSILTALKYAPGTKRYADMQAGDPQTILNFAGSIDTLFEYSSGFYNTGLDIAAGAKKAYTALRPISNAEMQELSSATDIYYTGPQPPDPPRRIGIDASGPALSPDSPGSTFILEPEETEFFSARTNQGFGVPEPYGLGPQHVPDPAAGGGEIVEVRDSVFRAEGAAAPAAGAAEAEEWYMLDANGIETWGGMFDSDAAAAGARGLAVAAIDEASAGGAIRLAADAGLSVAKVIDGVTAFADVACGPLTIAAAVYDFKAAGKEKDHVSKALQYTSASSFSAGGLAFSLGGIAEFGELAGMAAASAAVGPLFAVGYIFFAVGTLSSLSDRAYSYNKPPPPALVTYFDERYGKPAYATATGTPLLMPAWKDTATMAAERGNPLQPLPP